MDEWLGGEWFVIARLTYTIHGKTIMRCEYRLNGKRIRRMHWMTRLEAARKARVSAEFTKGGPIPSFDR